MAARVAIWLIVLQVWLMMVTAEEGAARIAAEGAAEVTSAEGFQVDAESSSFLGHKLDIDGAAPRELKIYKRKGGGFLQALGYALLGWIGLPLSFACLIVNEQNHARMQALLGRARSAMKPMNSDENNHDLDWTLIHTTGTSTSTDEVKDPEFASKNMKVKPVATNVVKMQRTAQMFQHVEKQKDADNNGETVTEYYMETQWVGAHVDNNTFQDHHKTKYPNPQPPRWQGGDDPFDATFYAGTVTLGQFEIPQPLKEKLTEWDKLGDPEWCYLSQNEGSEDNPKVGDVRVQWMVVKCGETTVTALKDDGNSFLPYRIVSRLSEAFCMWSEEKEKQALRAATLLSSDEYEATLLCPIPGVCCCCDLASKMMWKLTGNPQVFDIEPKLMTTEEIQQLLDSREGFRTTLCRVVGWLMMLISIMLIAHPLVVVLRYIPFLGNFLASILSTSIFLLALVVTLLVSAIVIGIAYSIFHPLLSIAALLFVAAVIVVGGEMAGPAGPANPASAAVSEAAKKLL